MMTKITLPIVGFSRYSVDYPDIVGAHGRVLKPSARECYTIFADDGQRYCCCRWKLIWAAEHIVDPRKIPREYSFREENGAVVCETFSDRMSETVKNRRKMAEVRWQDYDYIERFARTAKEMILGKPDAKTMIFALLNSRRDELIRYARTASGGVSLEKATLYTDKAILRVYDLVIEGCYHVPSPMASMKWHINHFIRQGRKRRQ